MKMGDLTPFSNPLEIERREVATQKTQEWELMLTRLTRCRWRAATDLGYPIKVCAASGSGFVRKFLLKTFHLKIPLKTKSSS